MNCVKHVLISQGCLEDVVLHDCWSDTDARPGDTVNVIADAAEAGRLHVSMGKGLLVLHPDVLLSGTLCPSHTRAIASSMMILEAVNGRLIIHY